MGRGVTRFNYLAAPGRPWFTPPPTVVAIDNRIRGPLAALLATIVVTAALGTVQLIRLHAAQDAYARASIRLQADELAIRDVDALRTRVARRRGLSDYADGLQRASLARTNELAWIGNRLPAHTWLRALRYENGRYTLEGSCARAAAVGAVILALRDETHAAIPQLVSLRDDHTAGATRVRFTLRLQTL
jgi:Tfp pilus assembly protein PilN